VLVGGMALVVLGSRRVTRDFDFLIAAPARAKDLVKVMYRHGLELVTKLDSRGGIVRTVDNPRVASAKLGRSHPHSLFFYDSKTRLRVDVLIDYPVPAHGVSSRATAVRFSRRTVKVARPEDLLRLKEMARLDRDAPSDAEDIRFLKSLLRGG